MVERLVEDAIQLYMASIDGEFTVGTKAFANYQSAKVAREHAQRELDGYARNVSGFDDVEAVQEKLTELHQNLTDAQEREERTKPTRATPIDLTDDWNALDLTAKRDYIRALIDTVTVSPGRGPERVTIEWVE